MLSDERRKELAGPPGDIEWSPTKLLYEANEMARELLELSWKPITETDLPIGRPQLLYFERDGEDVYAIGYFNRLSRSWFINGVDQGREVRVGFTHYRPINPPTKEKDNG